MFRVLFRNTTFLGLLGGTVMIVSVILASGLGSVNLSYAEVLQSLLHCPLDWQQCSLSSISQKIIWDIRLPRILLALITGAGLAITGAILQSVTRNPLADPYLFGISSGASLGAVTVLALIPDGVINMTVGALFGGIFSIVLMLVLAGRAVLQVEKLLLSGVAVSFMLSAFTSLILYYSSPELAAQLLFWMMGSFTGSQWNSLLLPFTTVVVGVILFLTMRRWLEAMQLGDESAFTLGIPVSEVRLIMLFVCAIITAILVSQVGGIGFVGLMIPHIARYIVGNQLHHILIASLFFGGSFMIWVDVLAHTLIDSQVLPIGIVTSAIGSLFFFVILKRRQAGQ